MMKIVSKGNVAVVGALALAALVPASIAMGYGGGGGGGIFGLIDTDTAPTIPAVTTTTSTTGSTGTTGTTGQVLGASAYNFTVNFGVGTRDEDVTQLQTILIADGYLNISAPTGYFGGQTKAAVILYQKAMGLPATGFVGPLTRADLNQGVLPTTSDEQKSLELQSLQQQLKALEAEIASMQSTTTLTGTVLPATTTATSTS